MSIKSIKKYFTKFFLALGAVFGVSFILLGVVGIILVGKESEKLLWDGITIILFGGLQLELSCFFWKRV